jgi:hypothetical protein
MTTALQSAQRSERSRRDQAWGSLNVLAKFKELDIEEEPDSLSVYGWSTPAISVSYFGRTDRKDYLRITRFWRRALKSAVSKFENRYDRQILETVGWWKWHQESFKITVNVDIGLREGCTLTYEIYEATRPVITCPE